jgi:glutamate carboxypeptidase
MDFEPRKPAMIALLKRLVETESPSHDKAAVDNVGRMVAEECRKLGADVEVVENPITGNQVVARFLPSLDVDPHPSPPPFRGRGILLLHHMDTVYPLGTLTKMPFYEKDNKIFGPGVMDMKGGIVITLTALAALKENGQLARPVTALFTSDEEIGSHTSRALIESLAREAVLVLVFESGLLDGALKTWRKGMGSFIVRVKGRAAHAGGRHQDGRNAIEELAHQVIAIQKMTDYAKGTTFNVGMIKGGTASNVVPDEAEAVVDFRVLVPEETERVYTAMRTLKPMVPDTSIEVSGGLNRPPMPNDALMQTTFARAQQIASSIGMELKAGGSGGGSDGNFVAPLGIPLLDGLGACGEGLHSEREYILVDSLPERAKLAAELIRKW